MRGQEFTEVINSLSDLDIEAFAFDNLFVGDGAREPDASIANQAKNIWSRIDENLGSESTVNIFGISMGGMIAATMATMIPHRIDNLILGATSPNTLVIPAVSDEIYLKWTNINSLEELQQCVDIAFGKTTILKNPRVVEDYFQYRIQKKNKQSRSDFQKQLDGIRAFPGEEIYSMLEKLPMHKTLISGEEDQLFPKSHADYISMSMTSHIRLDGTGHMLHLENTSDLIDIIAKKVIG